jgi:hypothetical protein
VPADFRLKAFTRVKFLPVHDHAFHIIFFSSPQGVGLGIVAHDQRRFRRDLSFAHALEDIFHIRPVA